MGWSAAAVAIGAGAGMAGSAMQAGAASDAADASSDAAAASNELMLKMYKTNRKDMMPWILAGQESIDRMKLGLRYGGEFDQFTMNDFLEDPGYQWRMDQGINALEAGGAATGMYGSGNMGAGLVSLGQDMGSQEYANAYSRWMDKYNKVAGVATAGQQQSQFLANMGGNTATAMGNNLMTAGQTQSNMIMNGGNAWANGFNNVGNQMVSGIGTYMNQQNQQALMNAVNGFSGGSAMPMGMSQGAVYTPNGFNMGSIGGGYD